MFSILEQTAHCLLAEATEAPAQCFLGESTEGCYPPEGRTADSPLGWDLERLPVGERTSVRGAKARTVSGAVGPRA